MKKHFYIFLDIDGVLWDYKWLKQEIENGKIKKGGLIQSFNSESVNALNYLFKKLSNKYEIYLVISSTYRKDMNKLKSLFKDYKLNISTIQNICPLPSLNLTREEEILNFVVKNKAKNYLIIDDETNNLKNLFSQKNIIKTNIYNSSLNMDMVKNALKNIERNENIDEK